MNDAHPAHGVLDSAGRISQFFTWSEAVGSHEAARLGIDNTPPTTVTDAILTTARRMDRVRRLLGEPVIVTSWYRCQALNRAIGSKDTSAHLRGEAVDFRCPQYGSVQQVFDYLRPLVLDLDVDQLIIEFPRSPRPWIHIGFSDEPRHQVLVLDEGGARLA